MGRAETWSAYGGLLEFKTHTNELLAMRLFPDTYRACTAVIRSRSTEDKIIQQSGELAERQAQYERRLLPLGSRERRSERRSRMKKRKKPRKTRIEVTSDLEDEAEGEDEAVVELKPIKPAEMENKEDQTPDYIRNSPVYQSIKSSKLKRDEIGAGDAPPTISNNSKSPTPPPPPEPSVREPQKDENLEISVVEIETVKEDEKQFKLVEITSAIRNRARDLCQIEARAAFATYLLRVQQRFMVEANLVNQTKNQRSDQIDLVCRFLTRASANLEQPLELNLPAPSTPMHRRKRVLGELLVDFIDRYNGETKSLLDTGASVSSGVCAPEQFDFFLKFATEQAVEDILTTYTQENKSASVFLGAKKAKKKKDPEKIEPLKEKPVLIEEEKKREQKVSRQRQVARDQMPTHQRRAMSQERQPKLLTERTADRSPFERSVRGAAYIYTTKPTSSSQTSRQPMLQSTAPTTANEAIKLALANLAERGNERHDDTTRVSNLAQQLAKINQHATRAANNNSNNTANRPSSAVVHRNSKYSSKYRNTINQEPIKPPNQQRERPKSAHPSPKPSMQQQQHTRVCWR